MNQTTTAAEKAGGVQASQRLLDVGLQLLAIVLALLFTTAVLLLTGAPPLQAYWQVLVGSFGSTVKISDVLVVWVPLLLCSTGLLITFAAGLWNIGVEGQIVLGAIFTVGVMRAFQDTLPPAMLIPLSILAGMIGGALWAMLAGALKIYGGVSEIFGGLGLDFVATAMTLWLIFGPWKRPGIGSMSGTEPFPESLWLPTLSNLRVSPTALLLSVVALVLIYFALRGTYWGLRTKAVGKNIRSAFLLGIPTHRQMMVAFAGCGVLAGLAGSIQVVVVYHRLIPTISSGYGWLGLLVTMLVNYDAVWVAPVAFFFAALNVGSIQLPISLQLDSSLSGVLQGALVLAVLLMQGVREHLRQGKE